MSELIATAASSINAFTLAKRVAAFNVPVLIQGETGAGKECVAKYIHTVAFGENDNAPYIGVNCAAIPENMLEATLFGYDKGAFTGAIASVPGKMELANNGTLLLDEIGDMPLDVQTRLLRVLADGQFYRVGGYAPVKVDVRIIAATHQNLEQRVQEGKFREDLFHRLNVIRVHLPPLRERREDIPRLARHFFTGCRARAGRRSEVAASGNRSRADASGVARQRAPAGKHLSLANGDGCRAGSVDSGFAWRTV